MTDYQLLNNKQHNNLRVVTRYAGELGHRIGGATIVDTELRFVQREYPVILRKHAESGRFFPIALLGFKEDENLFLDEQGHWRARHIPWVMAKGPFTIAMHDAGSGPQPTACVDLADPRVTDGGEGEALFREDGGPTQYMNHINSILSHLHHSTESVVQMGDLFSELDLIDPLRLNIQFNNGQKLSFEGGYTVSEEKLAALDESALQKLHKAGFLAAAYFISASIDNVQKLIDIRNEQLAASPETGDR